MLVLHVPSGAAADGRAQDAVLVVHVPPNLRSRALFS